jgi:hypothetical protein
MDYLPDGENSHAKNEMQLRRSRNNVYGAKFGVSQLQPRSAVALQIVVAKVSEASDVLSLKP